MTKKEIKAALKANNVKGYSSAVVTSAGWVVVGKYAGRINDKVLTLNAIDKNDTETKPVVINL